MEHQLQEWHHDYYIMLSIYLFIFLMVDKFDHFSHHA